MNEELLELYNSISPDVYDKVEAYNRTYEVKNTNVYMLAVPNEFYKAEHRVLMYGKETYGWFGEYNNGNTVFDRNISPNLSMQLYDLFMKEEVLTHKYNSPLWNEFCRLRDVLSAKSVGLLHNNVAKIGFEYGNTGFDHDTNMLFKDVFLKEIEILKPDFILFYTGPSYDRHLVDRFGSFSLDKLIANFEEHKFAKLSFENPPIKLPMVYRTYHPNYLRRTEFSSIRDYIGRLLSGEFSPRIKSSICIK